jgi:hypothetical protein
MLPIDCERSHPARSQDRSGVAFDCLGRLMPGIAMLVSPNLKKGPKFNINDARCVGRICFP